MMEYAGAALAEAVMRATSRGPVTVLAGGGNKVAGSAARATLPTAVVR